MEIRALDDTWRGMVNEYVRVLWGGPMMVTLDEMYDTSGLPGFVAVDGGALLGMALYREVGDECEVSALLSLAAGMGVGRALLDAVKERAAADGLRRLWLVTTNDNTRAIRFYQQYGFGLKAVHIGGFESTRRLKKELDARGDDGIAIEHIFEFELDPRA